MLNNFLTKQYNILNRLKSDYHQQNIINNYSGYPGNFTLYD